MNIKLDKRLILCFFLCFIITQGSSCGHIAEIIFEEPVEPSKPFDPTAQPRYETIVLDIKRLLGLQSHTHSRYTQSLAVHKDKAFVFYTEGYCKIIDLKDRKEIREATLASQSKDNHVNNAMFSKIFYEEEDKYPLLYISPYGKQACYVERYNEDDNQFELIQTITISSSTHNDKYSEFVVDADKNLLYAITFPGTGADSCHISIYNMPTIIKKQITLSDGDLLSIKGVKLEYLSILQGATYHKGYIYLLSGNQDTSKYLYSINTNDFSYRFFDFTDLFYSIEPEGLSVYDDKCYMCTNFPKAVWTFFRIEHVEK